LRELLGPGKIPGGVSYTFVRRGGRRQRVSYIDCYLAAVPRENRAAYEELARISAQVLREHGATRVVECWLDESGAEASTYHGTEARLPSTQYGTFVQAAGAREGETVVMSFVEWPDKAARDVGMERVTNDPRMQFDDRPPVFDGSRLIAAGFRPIPGLRGEA
jgi:uncharacterized protein YbaA (DUF1428 family)